MHGYKLTSITFADENECQDFDDWDDVGLNIAKPPELLLLYREGLKQSGQNTVSKATQTAEIPEPTQELRQTEIDNENLKLKVASLEEEGNELKSVIVNLQRENELLSSQITVQSDEYVRNNQKNAPSNKESLGSDSPERFEIIEKNMSIFHKKEGSVDDNLSNNSFNTNEWLNLSMPVDVNESQKAIKSSDCDLEKISNDSFIKEVFSICYVNTHNKLSEEFVDISNLQITNENLIHILSTSLLRIIPNVILNKREEVIPLLISAVHLNPTASERDKLLQQLFNLKKKPSDCERSMILAALICIAKCAGETLVENEILPQCWLQLAHKHVERRLLVVEACCALIPYVSVSKLLIIININTVTILASRIKRPHVYFE